MNKKIKIAFCNDINIFNIKSLMDENFAKKHTALFLHHLIKNIIKEGYEIAMNEDAIKKLDSGIWSPANTIIIQELDSKFGRLALERGAKPLILFAFEANFIGHWFYEKINKFLKLFKNIYLFEGTIDKELFNKHKVNKILFPSYLKKQLFNKEVSLEFIKSWEKKKSVVGIWSNKHHSLHLKKIINHIKNKNYKYLIQEFVSKKLSRNYKIYSKLQLQDKRIETFFKLSKLIDFDLYGNNWNSKTELPYKLTKKLKEYSNNIYNGYYGKDTLKDYKFCLCFENSKINSYVTEKIIDCFTNNCIPIYYGAPNISEIIPKKCFIDYRDFKNDDQLSKYLKNMTGGEAYEYLNEANNFLKSEKGKYFSYEYNVGLVIDKLDEVEKVI